MTNLSSNSEYKNWIQGLKNKIQSARTKVALSVNSQLIELYWELGKEIVSKLSEADWGAKVIEQISVDLKHDFPELKGFSRRNLYAIKQWYEFYSKEYDFVPQAVAQLPWGHNRLIISKIKEINHALFMLKNQKLKIKQNEKQIFNNNCNGFNNVMWR